MKKKLLLTLFVAMLSVMAFANISASAETYGDLTYTISYGEVIITDCDESATGKMVIPDTIDGYPVTSIREHAFYNCNKLTSITFPNSITSIGTEAFNECTGLTRVDITDLEAWCKISFGYAVSNPLRYAEKLYLNGELVTNLVIPDSFTSIGNSAFYGCKSLESIVIPNSVTSIGEFAFFGCTGLTSITIPDSVTSLEDGLFSKCTNLAKVSIPDSVTSIGQYAFNECTALTSITIPDSVTYIKYDAFEECTGLTDVYYPGTVADWNNISIGTNNSSLLNATIHFESNGAPEEPDKPEEPEDPETPEEPEEPEIPTHIPGDVNGDGEVDVRDVVALRRYIAGGYGIELK